MPPSGGLLADDGTHEPEGEEDDEDHDPLVDSLPDDGPDDVRKKTTITTTPSAPSFLPSFPPQQRKRATGSALAGAGLVPFLLLIRHVAPHLPPEP